MCRILYGGSLPFRNVWKHEERASGSFDSEAENKNQELALETVAEYVTIGKGVGVCFD